MCYKIFFFLLVLIGIVTGPADLVFSANQMSVYAVWSQPVESRMTTIQYASMSDGSWTEPIELTINEGLHVTPVIGVDKKDIIWIIWIEQTADENILRFAVIRHGKIETGRVGQAGNEQSYAPAIMIDNNETPWIAWSGVVNKFADIYSSRWNGSGWEQPVMANAKNDSPDITPILGLQEKRIPWISWFGITEAHSYVQFLAKWNNGEWQVDKNTLPSVDIGNFIKQRMGTETQLPEQARQRLMGAIFVNSEKGIQSISERFISFQPPRGQK